MTPATSRAARSRSPRPVRADRPPAVPLPIARVAVDMPLAHLDRPFDYLVSEEESDAAQPGVRVRVRFAGRLVNGFVLERVETSDHTGRLAPLERVMSPLSVLAPEMATLCRAVADRYAGTMADVLRLAVPPRHARVEKELVPDSEDEQPVVRYDDVVATGRGGSMTDAGDAGGAAVAVAPGDVGGARVTVEPADAEQAGADHSGADRTSAAGWHAYAAGPAFLSAVREHKPARAVWSALPGEDWPARYAEAARESLSAGRGALLIVPDARDLARLAAACSEVLPPDSYTALSADVGPAKRYRRFLAVRRGQSRVVIGTRAAAFAPVADLGLLAIFDDGDDALAEPRAPYPHARDVLILRSVQQRAALLLGGFARTAEGQLLVQSGWAAPIVAGRDQVRRQMPRIEGAGDEYAIGADSAAARARLPPAGFAAARRALAADAPVLIQVPRRGYLPAVACADCRRPARCRRCSGPLGFAHGARTPSCRWCGVALPRWACPACASEKLRAMVTGASRTAEEIGRAFPSVRLRTSAGDKILDTVPAEPAIIVATPGAEPVADGGYGAALLLDGGMLLARADLRAAEEALRRWMAAAALVRPAAAGGSVVMGAEVALPTVQALIRWDPAGHAESELAARTELGFPPVIAMASLEGAEAVVGAALRELDLPDAAEVLGPVPMERRRSSAQKSGAQKSVVRQAGSREGASRESATSSSTSSPTSPANLSTVDTEQVPEASHEILVRALVRVPTARRKELTTALRIFAAARSTHKGPAPLRIEMDPSELG